MLHQAATGSISTLQCKHSSEALAQDQVHENKACQSQNDDDYMQDKERTTTTSGKTPIALQRLNCDLDTIGY